MQPVGIVGVRVQQGEFDETGGGFRVGAGDASGTQGVGIKPGSLVTQFGDGVWMCRFCVCCKQISTPQGSVCAGT
ncbi:hypothetical protein GCM10012286_24890 [Streptomyces lasiicapitis]|uniref:Uncharacterized protein n=1 Tax=Streptomyces lasiicapitis TaxID=1923961 RepID=A0ABQ2LU35_9ACTN|nr:hypothetical protein GCM10012286_24890 [Streptomyces lasiicapitis]